MDIGTPVRHTDKDGNTYAGVICGKAYAVEHVDPMNPALGHERVDTSKWAVKLTYHDGQEKMADLSEDQLQQVVPFHGKPVSVGAIFRKPRPGAAHAHGQAVAPAAPAEIDYDKLAAALTRVAEARTARPAPAAVPPGPEAPPAAPPAGDEL